MELNIFTNKVRPEIRSTQGLLNILLGAYSSFVNKFGEVPVRVWCDSHPDTSGFEEYFSLLSDRFPVVSQTSSLSEGYRKAVLSSSEDYLFMLEHDWEFLDGIKHGLDDIIEEMGEQGLAHLRFNKRTNRRKRWDRRIQEKKGRLFDVCLTACVSNNPHIINRAAYTEGFLPSIADRKGSGGIERAFSRKHIRPNVAIYGGAGYPPTIRHLDGRLSDYR